MGDIGRPTRGLNRTTPLARCRAVRPEAFGGGRSGSPRSVSMNSEAYPKLESGAGLFAAALLSAIIGGVGAVLVVDRYPSLDLDEVFITSWWVLFSLLSALFLLVWGVRTGAPGRWRRSASECLLQGLLGGIGGILLSVTNSWSLLDSFLPFAALFFLVYVAGRVPPWKMR
jgi:hypothetical protein